MILLLPWRPTGPIRIHCSTQRHCTALPYPLPAGRRAAASRRHGERAFIHSGTWQWYDIQYIPTENASTLSRAHTHITVHRVAAARRQPGHCGCWPSVCCFACDPLVDWIGAAHHGNHFFTPLVTHGSRWCCHMRAEQKDCRQALIGSEVKNWRCGMDSTARKGDPRSGYVHSAKGGRKVTVAPFVVI
jgi:hypothetical protein